MFSCVSSCLVYSFFKAISNAAFALSEVSRYFAAYF